MPQTDTPRYLQGIRSIQTGDQEYTVRNVERDITLGKIQKWYIFDGGVNDGKRQFRTIVGGHKEATRDFGYHAEAVDWLIRFWSDINLREYPTVPPEPASKGSAGEGAGK